MHRRRTCAMAHLTAAVCCLFAPEGSLLVSVLANQPQSSLTPAAAVPGRSGGRVEWGSTCSWCNATAKLVAGTGAACREGTGGKLLRCSWCRSAFYCGRECQLAHWPSHRLGCPPTNSNIAAPPEAVTEDAFDHSDQSDIRLRQRVAAAEDIRDQAAANQGKLPLDWRVCRSCRLPVIIEWLDCPSCDRPISELDDKDLHGLLPEQTHHVQATKILGDAHKDLLRGAETNDLALMRDAVAAGANISATDPELYDSGALHYAAGQGQLQAVTWLLQRGVPVDVLNSCDESPLHWAAENGHTAVVKCLLAAGSDITRLNMWNEGAIDLAASAGYWELVSFLRGKGATEQPIGYAGKSLSKTKVMDEEALAREGYNEHEWDEATRQVEEEEQRDRSERASDEQAQHELPQHEDAPVARLGPLGAPPEGQVQEHVEGPEKPLPLDSELEDEGEEEGFDRVPEGLKFSDGDWRRAGANGVESEGKMNGSGENENMQDENMDVPIFSSQAEWRLKSNTRLGTDPGRTPHPSSSNRTAALDGSEDENEDDGQNACERINIHGETYPASSQNLTMDEMVQDIGIVHQLLCQSKRSNATKVAEAAAAMVNHERQRAMDEQRQRIAEHMQNAKQDFARALEERRRRICAGEAAETVPSAAWAVTAADTPLSDDNSEHHDSSAVPDIDCEAGALSPGIYHPSDATHKEDSMQESDFVQSMSEEAAETPGRPSLPQPGAWRPRAEGPRRPRSKRLMLRDDDDVGDMESKYREQIDSQLKKFGGIDKVPPLSSLVQQLESQSGNTL